MLAKKTVQGANPALFTSHVTLRKLMFLCLGSPIHRMRLIVTPASEADLKLNEMIHTQLFIISQYYSTTL